MLSVNTNTGAMVALQYLNQTQDQLADTQNAISTGLKVANAKDDGATYAIAQNMRSQVAGYGAVTDSLNRGMSTIDVALSAGQSISDLLVQMKSKALAASDKSLDTASRSAMDKDFIALRDQITTIVNNATFNGVNMVDGSTKKISALASADGANVITVSTRTLTLSSLGVSITIGTQTLAYNALASMDAAQKSVTASLAYLAAGAKKYSIQLGFTEKLSDTLTTGIGNLVDADMAKESALLTSLQTKQQLGVQALSIANQSPQIILSLFK